MASQELRIPTVQSKFYLRNSNYFDISLDWTGGISKVKYIN